MMFDLFVEKKLFLLGQKAFTHFFRDTLYIIMETKPKGLRCYDTLNLIHYFPIDLYLCKPYSFNSIEFKMLEKT